MPNLEELNKKLEDIGKAHKAYCEKNDKALEELKEKGHPNKEVEANAQKALDDVMTLKSQFEEMQKSYNRDKAADNFHKGGVKEKTEKFKHYILDAKQEVVDNQTVYTKEGRTAQEYKNLFFDKDGLYSEKKADQYRKHFEQYVRTGEKAPMNEHLKSMNVINDSAGGFLVSPVMGELIKHTEAEFSPWMQHVDIVTITANEIIYPLTNKRTGASRAAELAARTNTTAPTVKELTIKPEDLYAYPSVSQRMLDVRPDMESWLAEVVAQEFIITEAAEIATGDGVGGCRGLLSFAHGTSVGQVEQTAGGNASALVAASVDNLRTMDAKLKDAYGPNAKYFMRRATTALLANLKDGNGKYIWEPGFKMGRPDTIFGRPVVTAEDVPAVSTDALPILLGDLKRAYKYVTMPGVRVLRDPYTNKPFVDFYTVKRSSGDVCVHEALKILKIATSVS